MAPSVLNRNRYLDGFDDDDDDDDDYALSWVGVVGATRDLDRSDPPHPPYARAAPGRQKQPKTAKKRPKTTKITETT